MALTKVTYIDGVTVIYGQNLNDIQDAIIALEQGGSITVDSTMSNSSTNPVQNKVIYAALMGYLPLAGGTMTGALAMGGYKVTGLGAGSANTDAVTKKQLDDAIAGKITAPSNASDGQFLIFDGTNQEWTAQTVPSANGVSF